MTTIMETRGTVKKKCSGIQMIQVEAMPVASNGVASNGAIPAVKPDRTGSGEERHYR